MKNKIKVIAALMIVAILTVNLVYAELDDGWWEDANDFWNKHNFDESNDAMEVIQPIMDTITLIGNMIFVGVTVILGVKYIWGAAEAKAGVKDSMVTLVIAALVFYGWETIRNLLLKPVYGNTSYDNLFFISNDLEKSAASIFANVMYICNFLAIGGLVFIGVKYLMAGAEGRAQLKVQSVPAILGIVMVYATITFLNLIVSVL